MSNLKSFLLGAGAVVGGVCLFGFLRNRRLKTTKAEIIYQNRLTKLLWDYLTEAQENKLKTAEELNLLWMDKYKDSLVAATQEFEEAAKVSGIGNPETLREKIIVAIKHAFWQCEFVNDIHPYATTKQIAVDKERNFAKECVLNSVNHLLDEEGIEGIGWTSRRRYFGGNSGYSGYSKSIRAIEAENRGGSSVSNIDRYFLDQVNDYLLMMGESPVTISEIKKDIKAGNIRSYEWHHTSKYGNRTDYYFPKDIADFYSSGEVDLYGMFMNHENPLNLNEDWYNLLRERYIL